MGRSDHVVCCEFRQALCKSRQADEMDDDSAPSTYISDNPVVLGFTI